MTPPRPTETLLAIDVGNTRIGMAVLDDDGIHDSRRIENSQLSNCRDALSDLWRGTAAARSRSVVMGSVCPDAAAALAEQVIAVCGAAPYRVRDDLPLPMPLEIDNPSEVGVDRVCACAAAYDRLKTACAVASFGTAITVDCVSAEGAFLGGAILPGLELSASVLHDRTALLPHVRLARPDGIFARNTHDAIINGVVYGAVGALREIVERFAVELREWPQLVITGGNAAVVKELADFVDAMVPDLCLMGIALAYRKAAGQV